MKLIRRLIFPHRNVRRCHILTAIEHADEQLMRDVVQTVIRRYGDVFPDWDAVFYTLPKNPKERQKAVARLIHMLQTYELQPPEL